MRYITTNNNYKFKASNGKLYSTNDLFEMFLKLWTKDICTPRMRDRWSEDNPTTGVCSVTSFVIQDTFGGDVYGMKLDDGGYHCFNLIDGVLFDLTCEQFGEDKDLEWNLNYKQEREQHFKDINKYNRYKNLKEKFMELINE